MSSWLVSPAGVVTMVPVLKSGVDARGHSAGGNLPRHSQSVGQSALLLAFALLGLLATPAWAVNCTSQGEMQPADRDALIAAGNPIAGAVAAQNFDLLQASLLSSITGDWDSIRGVAQGAAPVLKGGQLQWRNLYLLDASDLKGPADTQFFCTNADSSMTVTVDLHALPQGKYALLIGDYPGSPLAGQLALILAADSAAGGKWKLGGLFVREGSLEGHDGVWYWTQARALGQKNADQKAAGWSAWFSYDTARWLLLPVDFMSTPNLEKLNREQMQLKASPLDSLPITVSGDGGKSWRVTALHLDTTLHTADLALTYEGTGLTEPAAARAEAILVMSALLKLHPELRESFHGLWAYAETDGKRSYAIELAMHDIP